MKIAVNSILSLLDVGTGFCYWLLGRDLLEDEVKRIQELYTKIQKPEDEPYLVHELNSLAPGKDLLLVCDAKTHNLVQWSILNNYSKALQVLLDYGCNPTRTGLPDYDLSLALACCLNHLETIELLLNYGANPSDSTMLSADVLTFLSSVVPQERYLKLMDLLKYRNSITSLSIVLTFDDLILFRLLMGETSHSSSLSASSISSSSSVNLTPTIDDSNMKLPETDFDIFREKLKIENYVDTIITDGEEALEHPQIAQQHLITNDDMSDYAEHGHLLSFCDTLDAESALVNHDDGIQTLSEKCNQIGRITEEETFVPRATTDGGYYTVDGSSGRVKSQPPLATLGEQQLREIHLKENTENICPVESAQVHHYHEPNDVLPRTKSQQQLAKFLSNGNLSHRHSLPANVYENSHDQPSKRFRSTSSFLLSNMANSTKHTAHLLRLLHQMIEHEAATVLEYFLKKHRTEFNDHFHTAANSSDIQLKTYELLSNIKSDKIYNVLVSSNCAYFNTVTTSLCDRENNTLVHSLLAQNPSKYQPTEMIKMLERYMSNGLKEFINRPNLSNHCMIQILLCNEHFLKMLFFPRSLQSSSKYLKRPAEAIQVDDPDSVDKWRQTFLILIETLIKHGARIDISAGSYRNSLDCLLSSLIDLAKQLIPLTTIFDMKYLKRLIILLLSSLNSKARPNYLKSNIERFLQLLYLIHINNDDLSDILSIVHLLLQYECQPLRLNLSTLMQFFRLWLTNPNFLCSSLIGKDLFMQQFLTILIRRLNQSATQQMGPSIYELPLIVTTTNTLQRKLSITNTENELCLQSLFQILLSLISLSQTCLQIHSIYELILIFINHTSIDIINKDFTQPPIVFLCSQIKLINHCLLIPFIDLFLMTHSSAMINKTREMLSQLSIKRLSADLYKYFLSNEKSKQSVRSLRHLTTKCLYHHAQKPFHESTTLLPISETLKERLIHFHDI